jgi:hypothetical protein
MNQFQCVTNLSHVCIATGNYIILRDGNKPQLRMYAVPSLDDTAAGSNDEDDELQDEIPYSME